MEALTATADPGQVSIKERTKPGYPKRSDIETIMFLSRRLSPAGHRYWPTGLEVAGLVWCLRKIRHLVESSKLPIRIYTDHGASLGIAKQSSNVTLKHVRGPGLDHLQCRGLQQCLNHATPCKPQGQPQIVSDPCSRAYLRISILSRTRPC